MMPIGVPLIICGSIALAGSGYAFKKLIYDPHLAHYVEAFIANHRVKPVDNKQIAVPVAAHSTATTTAWSGGLNRLRRRGRKLQEQDQEDGEPLIQLNRRESIPDDRPAVINEGYDNYDHTSAAVHDNLLGKSYKKEDRATDTPTPHDDEIKSLIFNISPSAIPEGPNPTESNTHPRSPASGPDPGFLHVSPGHLNGPSATFSFLSLSQVSSPEAPAAMLDSMTFSHIGTGFDRSEGDRREDVMSLPDTTGYQSNEGEEYSNVSSPRNNSNRDIDVVWSPSIPSSSLRGNRQTGSITGGLGLSAVEDVGMSYIVSPRRQESVISLSESQGGGGSDWEAISARST